MSAAAQEGSNLTTTANGTAPSIDRFFTLRLDGVSLSRVDSSAQAALATAVTDALNASCACMLMVNVQRVQAAGDGRRRVPGDAVVASIAANLPAAAENRTEAGLADLAQTLPGPLSQIAAFANVSAVTPSAWSTTDPTGSGDSSSDDGLFLPLPILAGGAAGIFVILVLTIVLICCCCKRRKRRSSRKARHRLDDLGDQSNSLPMVTTPSSMLSVAPTLDAQPPQTSKISLDSAVLSVGNEPDHVGSGLSVTDAHAQASCAPAGDDTTAAGEEMFSTGAVPVAMDANGTATATSTHEAPVPAPRRSIFMLAPESNVEMAVAIYSYTARGAEELSFEVGTRIRVIRKEDDGWWHGELDGEQGMFPGSYVTVEENETDVDALPETGNGGTAMLPPDHSAMAEAEGSEAADVPAAAAPLLADPDLYVAKFEYVPQPGELALAAGQQVRVKQREESGWWAGETNDGNMGWFPSEYVVPVGSAEDPTLLEEPTREEMEANFALISRAGRTQEAGGGGGGGSGGLTLGAWGGESSTDGPYLAGLSGLGAESSTDGPDGTETAIEAAVAQAHAAEQAAREMREAAEREAVAQAAAQRAEMESARLAAEAAAQAEAQRQAQAETERIAAEAEAQRIAAETAAQLEAERLAAEAAEADRLAAEAAAAEADRLAEAERAEMQAAAEASAASPMLGATYRALYPYEQHGDGDLPLEEGRVVTLLSTSESWWFGRSADGSEGWFPSIYVMPTGDPIVEELHEPEVEPDETAYETIGHETVANTHGDTGADASNAADLLAQTMLGTAQAASQAAIRRAQGAEHNAAGWGATVSESESGVGLEGPPPVRPAPTQLPTQLETPQAKTGRRPPPPSQAAPKLAPNAVAVTVPETDSTSAFASAPVPLVVAAERLEARSSPRLGLRKAPAPPPAAASSGTIPAPQPHDEAQPMPQTARSPHTRLRSAPAPPRTAEASPPKPVGQTMLPQPRPRSMVSTLASAPAPVPLPKPQAAAASPVPPPKPKTATSPQAHADVAPAKAKATAAPPPPSPLKPRGLGQALPAPRRRSATTVGRPASAAEQDAAANAPAPSKPVMRARTASDAGTSRSPAAARRSAALQPLRPAPVLQAVREVPAPPPPTVAKPLPAAKPSPSAKPTAAAKPTPAAKPTLAVKPGRGGETAAEDKPMPAARPRSVVGTSSLLAASGALPVPRKGPRSTTSAKKEPPARPAVGPVASKPARPSKPPNAGL